MGGLASEIAKTLIIQILFLRQLDSNGNVMVILL